MIKMVKNIFVGNEFMKNYFRYDTYQLRGVNLYVIHVNVLHQYQFYLSLIKQWATTFS